MKKMLYTDKKRNLYCIVLSILLILFLLLVFGLYLQIETPVKKYFVTKKGYKIHVNILTGKKNYKIGNNEFAYFDNFKNGYSIDMPNMFGCSQIIISDKNKLLVIHYRPDVMEYKRVKCVLDNNLQKFSSENIPNVEFSFSSDKPNEYKFFKKHIISQLDKKFKNGINIHYTLFPTLDKSNSCVYNYSVVKTSSELKVYLEKRKDILNVLRNNVKFETIKNGDRVVFDLLYDDYAFFVYQQNKIIAYRFDVTSNNDDKITKNFENLLKNFNKFQKIQVVFVTPENFDKYKIEKLKKDTLKTLKPFWFKDISYYEYKNGALDLRYSGFLRCGKIRGRIKKNHFGKLQER